jgi:hypothetical protein
LFCVLCPLCCSVYCLCVNVYCSTTTWWLPNFSYVYIMYMYRITSYHISCISYHISYHIILYEISSLNLLEPSGRLIILSRDFFVICVLSPYIFSVPLPPDVSEPNNGVSRGVSLRLIAFVRFVFVVITRCFLGEACDTLIWNSCTFSIF